MAKILLVDDDAALLAAMVAYLQTTEHEVTLAADGKEAMDLVNRQAFDLVIIDLIMPEKEGLETIRELRTKSPAIRIVAMSGSGSSKANTNLRMAQMFGAGLTLEKPFTGEKLLEVVKAALQ